MADPTPSKMIDPAIFSHLQDKIDEDAAVREVYPPVPRSARRQKISQLIHRAAELQEIQTVLHKLDRQDRTTQSILSRAHSIPSSQCTFTSRWVGNNVLTVLVVGSRTDGRSGRQRCHGRDRYGGESGTDRLEPSVLQVCSPLSMRLLWRGFADDHAKVQRDVDARGAECGTEA